MAVPVQTPYQEYTANGVTTSFAVTFQCLSIDTLIVTINGVEQSPTLWSFTGGNVVFVAAPANLAIVGIKRSTALTREVTYQSYDNSLRPDVLNNDIDRLWHVLQENQYIYNKKVDKSAQIQTLGNLQGGGQINGGLTLSLKDQTVTANYAFGSSIKIPVITLNHDGTVKSLHDVDLIGGAGGAFQIGWNDVLNKPTTLAGYGITNAYTKTEANDLFIENTEKGAPNGVTENDTDGKVKAAQLPVATEAVAGVVEFATQAETNAGTNNVTAVTPLKLLAGVKNHLNATGSAPMYACRAWIDFNGTGTPAINASGNFSSITDNGTGNYSLNFTLGMPNSNYAVSEMHNNQAGGQHAASITSRTTSSVTLQFTSDASNSYPAIDPTTVLVSIIG